ncbi:MAG: UvrD-helicase domain-containing protein, partial [Planctomycetes bacterium]|nr:UvrD-helicase domain-containing protein [Planctomycetota bacterium]
MSVKELLSGLNDRQRQAVETTKGPVLVLAGPGSGKTKVVTSRIAYLLEQGAAPEEILAITFTKKAAKEMKERVALLLGKYPKGLTICTFHALGYKILRDNHRLAGLEPLFDIVTDREQDTIAKKIISQLPDDRTCMEAPELLRRISLAKNLGISPDDLQGDADSYTQQCVSHVYAEYEKTLRERGAVDLDDLILRPLRDLFE